jgi:hypothetical protein
MHPAPVETSGLQARLEAVIVVRYSGAVREHARQMIAAGPTEDDPFTIAREIAAALPGDSHAAALADTWHTELDRMKAD